MASGIVPMPNRPEILGPRLLPCFSDRFGIKGAKPEGDLNGVGEPSSMPLGAVQHVQNFIDPILLVRVKRNRGFLNPRCSRWKSINNQRRGILFSPLRRGGRCLRLRLFGRGRRSSPLPCRGRNWNRSVDSGSTRRSRFTRLWGGKAGRQCLAQWVWFLFLILGGHYEGSAGFLIRVPFARAYLHTLEVFEGIRIFLQNDGKFVGEPLPINYERSMQVCRDNSHTCILLRGDALFRGDSGGVSEIQYAGIAN